MPDSQPRDNGDRRILELAVARGKLTAEQVETLVAEASGSTCDLAIQRNLISAADVDILRPLCDPTGFLPDYEFIDMIGEGAIGTVYKARQIRLNRPVAIKMLKQSALENHTATARSLIEAQLTARMQHPNIVAVYDYGVQDGRVYLAMEFVEGESILEHIEQHGAVEPDLALQLVKQMISALSHAADNGVIHRDIKPANVLLTDNVPGLILPPGTPAAKVLDFGLAFESQNKDATRLTADGAALGTPGYVAPEQLMNSSVDVRADIYALGATLYHMATGKPPFGDANAFQALAAKMQGSEEWRSDMGDVPASVQRLVLDMTHHAVDDRIADYGQLSKRIEDILDGRDSTTTLHAPTSPTPPHSFSQSSRQLRLASLAGATLLLVGAIGYLISRTFNSGDLPSTTPQLEVPVEIVREHLLFDGISTPHDAVVRGAWSPTRASDGGYVLEGKNNAILRCKVPDSAVGESEFFRFRFRVNPLDDAIVDICLAVTDSQQCHLLRFEKQTVQLGIGSRNTTEFEPIGDEPPTVLFQPAEGPTYFSVLVDHHPGRWLVNVEGNRLGTIAAVPTERPQILLRATVGKSHFEDLSFFEIRPTSTPP